MAYEYFSDKELGQKELSSEEISAILDFLQFLHKNIKDPTKIGYHDYHLHNHYSFSDNGLFKFQFREYSP